MSVRKTEADIAHVKKVVLSRVQDMGTRLALARLMDGALNGARMHAIIEKYEREQVKA